jgi:hypothetical protein
MSFQGSKLLPRNRVVNADHVIGAAGGKYGGIRTPSHGMDQIFVRVNSMQQSCGGPGKQFHGSAPWLAPRPPGFSIGEKAVMDVGHRWAGSGLAGPARRSFSPACEPMTIDFVRVNAAVKAASQRQFAARRHF